MRTVADEGSVTVPLKKLLRLLEKGNRAAGTWKALLYAWEDIDESRTNLHIAELPGQMILLSSKATVPVTLWAGDKGTAANSNLLNFAANEAAH